MELTSKSPCKPPLITPSASPPPNVTAAKYDGVPPFKRQRLSSSTPRRDFQSSTPPKSADDVLKEREASKLRLLDVWDSLADRYTRRLDEDDIIDIQAWEITRDNGILRKSKKLRFGDFALPNAGNLTGDESSDVAEEDEEEDEYDLDELDAFAASEPEIVDGIHQSNIKADVMPIPPVTPLDPADAKDLEDFLDAERRRKELCGSDDEEAIDETSLLTGSSDEDDGVKFLNDADHTSLVDDDKGADDLGEQGRVGSSRTQPFLETSEDELDNWKVDSASAVRPIVKHEQESNDSDIEIIEPPSIINQSDTPSREDVAIISVDTTPTQNRHKTRKLTKQSYLPSQSKITSSLSATFPRAQQTRLPSTSPPLSPILPNHRTSSLSPKKSSSQPKTLKSRKSDPNFGDPASENMVRSTESDNTIPWANETSPSTKGTLKVKRERTKPFVLLTPRKDKPLQSLRVEDDTLLSVEDYDLSDPSEGGKNRVKKAEYSPSKFTANCRDREGPSSRNLPKKLNPASTCPLSDDECNLSASEIYSVSSSPTEEFGKTVPKNERYKNQWESGVFADNKNDISRSRKFPIPEPGSPMRKRKRKMSDVQYEYPTNSPPEKAFETYGTSDKRSSIGDRAKVGKSNRVSSRSRQVNSESESEVSEYKTTDLVNRNRRKRSFSNHDVRTPEYPLAHPHMFYPLPNPHPNYPPIPDPRAQLIIAQAMHQLSTLVGNQWQPHQQYIDGEFPHTPTRRPQPHYSTPTNHQPYPYFYNPEFSNATLPPDSPEFQPSPAHLPSKKALVRRSRSRGRRVSFTLEEESSNETDIYSTPSRNVRNASGKEKKDDPSQSKGKAKAVDAETDSESVPESLEDQDLLEKNFPKRGQTPGPSARATPSIPEKHKPQRGLQ